MQSPAPPAYIYAECDRANRIAELAARHHATDQLCGPHANDHECQAQAMHAAALGSGDRLAAKIVVATKASLLNEGPRLAEFDLSIVDEVVDQHLYSVQPIVEADLVAWWSGMEQHRDLYPDHCPQRQLWNTLYLAAFAYPTSERQPLLAALLVVRPDVAELLAVCAAEEAEQHRHGLPFEQRHSALTADGHTEVIPLVYWRELVGELQRLATAPNTPNTLWLDTAAISCYRVNQSVINLLTATEHSHRLNAIILDATPSPLLAALLPHAERWHAEVKQHLQVTQITDSLLTSRHLSARGGVEARRLAQAINALAGDSVSYAYDELGRGSGLGQRTSMVSGSGTYYNYYSYDARSRQSQADYWVKYRAHNIFQYQYDSSDKVTQITYPSSERVGYTYDYAWRQTSVCSNYPYNICYAQNANYTALDQPQNWTYGNNDHQTWSYDAVMKRLSGTRVWGPAAKNVGTVTYYDSSYSYDAVGNMSAYNFSGTIGSSSQSFQYDHRDRLTTWTRNGSTEVYQFDILGNINNKANTAYSYKQNDSNGVNRFPHAATGIGGNTYHYDNNGNMSDDGAYGHNFSWNGFNQMTGVYNTANNPLEVYAYDADGSRSKRTANSVNTFYEGLMEYDEPNGQPAVVTERRYYYTLAGQTVAQRTANSSNDLVNYIHPDSLGSTRLTTSENGGVSGWQEYNPWGQVINQSSGGQKTKLNYTGQRLDDTGLLYYNSRYYNPNTARFLQADSIVPDAAGGGGGKPNLTVDFHEAGFVTGLNADIATNANRGFYFQLSGRDKGQAVDPNGATNPQALNRYSYVQNNPTRYKDPSGHTMNLDGTDAAILAASLHAISDGINAGLKWEGIVAMVWAAARGIAASYGKTLLAGAAVSAVITGLLGAIGIVIVAGGVVLLLDAAERYRLLADMITRANEGGMGVAITETGGDWPGSTAIFVESLNPNIVGFGVVQSSNQIFTSYFSDPYYDKGKECYTSGCVGEHLYRSVSCSESTGCTDVFMYDKNAFQRPAWTGGRNVRNGSTLPSQW